MKASRAVAIGTFLWSVLLTDLIRAEEVETRFGTLEFVVSDTFGKPLKSFHVEISDANRRDSTPKIITAPGSIRLPYGEYLVTGTASLHQAYWRRVRLSEDRVLVLVGFSFHDPGHSARPSTPLKGRITGGKIDSRNTMVKVMAIWGTFEKESRVDNSGSFEINEVPYGEYMILVLQGTDLVASQKFGKTIRDEEATIGLQSGGRQ